MMKVFTLLTSLVFLVSLSSQDDTDFARPARPKRQFDDLDPDETDTSDCSAGSIVYTTSDGAKGCTECPAGTYANTADTTAQACTPCALDTYAASAGQTECTACKGDLQTIGTNSKSDEDCTSEMCKIPVVANGYYTRDNTRLLTDTRIAWGEELRLVCNDGYFTESGSQAWSTVCNDHYSFGKSLPASCTATVDGVALSPKGNVFGIQGQSLQLTCSVNKQTKHFDWYKDSNSITDEDTYLQKQLSEIMYDSVGNSHQVLTVSEEGKYYCKEPTSVNNADTATVQFLFLKVFPNSETITISSSNRTFEMIAIASYDTDLLPHSELSWSKDGVHLANTVFSKQGNELQSVVKLEVPASSDSGNYTAFVNYIDNSGDIVAKTDYTVALRVDIDDTECHWITEYGACYQHSYECKKRVNIYCSCNRDPTKCSGAADVKDEYCDKSECEMSGGAVSKSLAGIMFYSMSFVMFCV